jgi:hypothetical protein
MNFRIILVSTVVILASCHHPLKDPAFVSEHIGKNATILLHGKPEQVFPLFGAFEERKWAEGWAPVLIYPDREIITEGTTFLTHGHGHSEEKYTWLINRLDTSNFMIQYLVYTENRHWTITIRCQAHGDGQTEADVTYQFTGHNEKGNEINRHLLDKMYKKQLQDWAEDINRWLAKKQV